MMVCQKSSNTGLGLKTNVIADFNIISDPEGFYIKKGALNVGEVYSEL